MTMVSRFLCVGVAVFISVAVATARNAAGTIADRLERQMKVLGITLEETTLLEAQQLIGPTDLRDNGGDAGAYLKVECYVGRDGTVLALVSNDMGGGTIIMGYQLVARESLAEYSNDPRYVVPVDKRPRCANLKTLSRFTATNGGLKLGMKVDDVRRMLGVPTRVDNGYQIFTSEMKVAMTPEQAKSLGVDQQDSFFTRTRGLRVEFSHGRIVAIRAWQVTST